MSRQGVVDEGLIDSVDDAINSTVSTAAHVLGGKKTDEESTKECRVDIMIGSFVLYSNWRLQLHPYRRLCNGFALLHLP